MHSLHFVFLGFDSTIINPKKIVDRCIIQVIEENNGVEKLASIINSQILEKYKKPQIAQSPLIEKAIVYLKYQSNYEVFEEAYRTFLTKRYFFY